MVPVWGTCILLDLSREEGAHLRTEGQQSRRLTMSIDHMWRSYMVTLNRGVQHENPITQLGIVDVPLAMLYDSRISKGACCYHAVIRYHLCTGGAVPTREAMASSLGCTVEDLVGYDEELVSAGYLVREQDEDGTTHLVLANISKMPHLRDLAERILVAEYGTI
jgi:hypothetical protein